MSQASSLKQCKVYRSGLIDNVSNAQGATAYATWAAEAVYRQMNGVMNAGSTTMPLSSTAGISVGMRMSGAYTYFWGGVLATVTAINPGVSVTVSAAVSGNIPAGTWYRFGPSVAIAVPYNASGITLDELTIVGFRTGIQTAPSQYFIGRVRVAITPPTSRSRSAAAITAVALPIGRVFLPLYGATPTLNRATPSSFTMAVSRSCFMATCS